MRKPIKWLSIAFVLNVLSSSEGQAATINAASCSRTDVGNAVASATHGDKVIIPACSQTNWTTQLNLTVGITIQGAGIDKTTIGDNVPKNGGNTSRLIQFNVASPNNFRLTGMTIVGVATDPSVFNKGHVHITGSSKAFRIDHIKFSNMQTSGIRAEGDLWGVIDHSTFLNDTRNALVASHDSWGGADFGDGSWSEQLYWGTEKAIYFEDNTYTSSDTIFVGNMTDCFDGGRIVVRYNTLTGGNTTAHGTDSSQRRRSCRSQEIYNNTATFPSSQAPDFFAWIRGGTGVIHNNTLTAPGGLNQMVKGDNLRDSQSFSPWGMCNGSSSYDQNLAGQSGYRCVDQPGAGTSIILTGDPPLPVSFIGNINDPFYVWNNTLNGSARNNVGATTHVQANRDYFMGIARPGYTPYTYPHPLVGPITLPPSPSNLSVTP